MVQLPSLAREGGVCSWAWKTYQEQIMQQECSWLPLCQSNPWTRCQALAKGLARTPPLQMEKGTFPPWWVVGRSCAPASILHDLRCISIVTPVLFIVQVQCMGTRSDGKMEPHICGYRMEKREAHLSKHHAKVCGRGNSINRNV